MFLDKFKNKEYKQYISKGVHIDIEYLIDLTLLVLFFVVVINIIQINSIFTNDLFWWIFILFLIKGYFIFKSKQSEISKLKKEYNIKKEVIK